jgi:tRNA threonylcarbamoyladenosine biosynthesis protein TsaB
MRVLALETSSQRGSVALFEGTSFDDARLCAFACHAEPNRHAERIWGLMDEVFSQAGFAKEQIDRIAVGVGPGAFTGIRVGLALAQGLMLGLGVEGVGVGSLRALSVSVPESDTRLRVVLRDARREEFFLAAYDARGVEVVPPEAIPQGGAAEVVRAKFEGSDYVVLGTEVPGLPCLLGEGMIEPDARGVGRLGLSADPARDLVLPEYVRGPNVIKPNLPLSPLAGPRVD